MLRILGRSLFLSSLLVACSAADVAPSATAPPTTTAVAAVDGRAAALDRRLAELDAQFAPLSVSAAVALEDFVWLGERGFADARRTSAITKAARYRVGSITKTFVSAIVFQLVEEEKLSLEDKLARWEPSFPNATAITVENLLGHTSGVFDYPLDPKVAATAFMKWEPDELIARAAAHESQFEPGTKHVYNQTNYVLLGRIVERVTGKRFRDVLAERITKPLGLLHTDLDDENLGLTDGTESLEKGHYVIVTGVIHPSVAWTAGALASTTTDLLAWSRALYEEGRVVKPETVKRMCAAIRLADGTTPVEYGSDGPYGISPALGCWVEHTTRGDRVGHRGETAGFNAQLSYQAGVGHAVLLQNTRTGKARTMTEELWRVALAPNEMPAANQVGGRR